MFVIINLSTPHVDGAVNSRPWTWNPEWNFKTSLFILLLSVPSVAIITITAPHQEYRGALVVINEFFSNGNGKPVFNMRHTASLLHDCAAPFTAGDIVPGIRNAR